MLSGLSILAAAAAAIATTTDVSIPGPNGPLGGALTESAKGAPVVILVPGSGPTDRDGNNALGVAGGVYKQLADALADKGVASLRIDKRGMFSSKAAIPDANRVRLTDYAADVHVWARFLKSRGSDCAWVAGHSEGGLVALVAAQDPADICGIILLAAPGRPMGAILRDQLGPKLPAEMMPPVEAAIVKLEHGETVDPATVPAPVAPLFNHSVQPFMIELARTNPATLAAKIRLPVMIVWGEQDVQVTRADFDALRTARTNARVVVLDGANHLFKTVPAGDTAANLASYADAEAKIDSRLASAIAEFVTARAQP